MLKLFNTRNIVAKVFAAMAVLVYTIFFIYVYFFIKGDGIIFLAFSAIPTSIALSILINFFGIPGVATQAIAIYIAGILQYSFLGYWVGFVLNELIRALIKEKQAQQPSTVLSTDHLPDPQA